METDADRLALIQGLGGQLVSCKGARFWAIFDNQYADALLTEGSTPAITCRSSDVASLEITKDDVIELNGVQWRARREEPDGLGMTVIRLRR